MSSFKGLIGDEAVFSVVSRTMADKRVLELKRENAILRAKLKRIEDALKEKCGYAFDLVWYARSNGEGVAAKSYEDVEEKWPEEVEALQDCDSNWQHGFNSGVLAVDPLVRGVMSAEETVKSNQEFIAKQIAEGRMDVDDEDAQPPTVENEVEFELDSFPMLDT